MALQAASQQMVTEFDYTADQVNRAVKEFLREMGQSVNVRHFISPAHKTS